MGVCTSVVSQVGLYYDNWNLYCLPLRYHPPLVLSPGTDGQAKGEDPYWRKTRYFETRHRYPLCLARCKEWSRDIRKSRPVGDTTPWDPRLPRPPGTGDGRRIVSAATLLGLRGLHRAQRTDLHGTRGPLCQLLGPGLFAPEGKTHPP